MLHPQAAKVIAATADDISVADARFDVVAERERVRKANLKQPREDVARVEDLDARGVRVRLYAAPDAHGVIVHAHGGGFVLNDIDVHDRIARMLANRSGATVISVDYRRPPEHPYPAAVDDMDAVVAWLAETDDPDVSGPIAVHGDSAGACLALVAALRHRERFAAQVLIYPFIDAARDATSYCADGVGFEPDEARWYWSAYAGGDQQRLHLLADPNFSPVDTDYAGLPPTLIATAEHDILRTEGEALAVAMEQAGVSVVATRYLGMIHGFWRFVDQFDASEVLMGQVVGFLREHGVGRGH